jgi:hypothetical protein
MGVITDHPMPGVAKLGTRALWIISRKGDNLKVDCIYGINQLDSARAEAWRIAHSHDEVVVLDGKLMYRIWDRDKNPQTVSAELAMG